MTKAIDLFAQFQTDTTKEKAGVSTPLPGCGDTEFVIARAGNANADYALKAQALHRKHKTKLEAGGAAARDLNNAIMAELYAETVLLGWKGTLNLGGVDTPYSKEAALKLLLLPDFRELVEAVANKKDAFLTVAANDDEVKN